MDHGYFSKAGRLHAICSILYLSKKNYYQGLFGLKLLVLFLSVCQQFKEIIFVQLSTMSIKIN